MDLNNLSIELQRLSDSSSTFDEKTIRKAIEALRKCESNLLDSLNIRHLALDNNGLMQTTIDPLSNNDCSIIPPKVLDLVYLSEFLTVKECGRLLLLASKSMLQSYGEKHAWEVLCSRQWKNTVSIPESIVQKRGYQWLFRQLSGGGSQTGPISEPSLTFEVLTMLISVRNAEGSEVVSLALKKEQLKKFLTKGELNIALQKVSIGNFSISQDGELESVEVSKWSASIVLFRTDTCQCAHLHQSQSCCYGEYDYMDDPNIENEYQEEKVTMEKVGWGNTVTTVPRPKVDAVKPPPEEVDMGYLEFASAGLEMTRRGKMLEDRIRADSLEDPYVQIKMEPTVICHTQDYCESSKSIDLVSTELRLDIWKQYTSGAAELYHSANEVKKHGITMLHLLDELQDWQ